MSAIWHGRKADQERVIPLHVMVGENVREYRQQLRWSRRALARRAGISDATILRLEAGQIDIRTQTLAKLAQALGVPPAALLSPVPSVRALRRGAGGRPAA